jgi:hypothetical protein
MQQGIGFCTTADGARIAYATVGTGPALVVASPGVSHLELECVSSGEKLPGAFPYQIFGSVLVQILVTTVCKSYDPFGTQG